MAAKKIEVNTAHLDAGGNRSQDAAGSARRAAEELRDKPVGSGIFGDFSDARRFNNTLSAAHQAHQDQLHGHHAALNAVAGKAAKSAEAFRTGDESAADTFGSAGDRFA